jgi:hypothetical protein
MVAIVTIAEAQGKFCLGPKIGYNSNKITDNFDSIRSDIKNSFQVGAFVRIGSRFYLQPEANYQVSESTLSKNVGYATLSQDITIKTLKVPILLGVKLINQGKFNIRIMAGPAVSFAIDKQLSADQSSFVPIQSENDFKNKTWSVQMGAGVDVFSFTLDVRYEVGVDNLYQGNYDMSIKNNIFNVSLGMKFL